MFWVQFLPGKLASVVQPFVSCALAQILGRVRIPDFLVHHGMVIRRGAQRDLDIVSHVRTFVTWIQYELTSY